jgi:hypothetical protein
MKKKIEIPDDYFDEQEFLVDEVDEELVLGILGKNPTADQLLKYELCTYIARLIDKRGMSLIKNHHLDRFTIDRLIKIYGLLDTQQGVGDVLKSASMKIGRMTA